MDTTYHRGSTGPAEAPPARPTVVAGDEQGRARLRDLVETAAAHLGEPAGGRMLAAVDRVSQRFGRLSVHWRRPPSAIERAAVDLAAAQERLAGADHLVEVRRAGRGA